MAERFNTVIIGGGQSGLATGYQLSQRGKDDYVILDACERVGDSWRKRWDSLRLFTWADHNNLPGMDFPADPDHLPTKDETADYLEQYAEKFSLPVRTGIEVQRVTREGDTYLVDAGDQQFEADNVVVATGPFQRPKIPDFASDLDSSISQMHSSEYTNPSQLPDGDVLVVGAATSGCQIGMELAEAGRKVYVSGREVGALGPVKANILRKLGLVGWVHNRPRDSFVGKKIYAKKQTSGDPLILFTYKDVDRSGVERVARTAGVKDGKPVLESGEQLDVANVIWCTGFKPNFSWIDLPVFEEDGYPRHVRGVVDEEPGLYFIGLVFLHSLSSQVLLGAARDSDYLASELVRRESEAKPQSPPEAAPESPVQAAESAK